MITHFDEKYLDAVCDLSNKRITNARWTRDMFEGCKAFLFVEDDFLLGYLCYNENQFELEILQIATQQGFERRGIATSLVDSLKHLAGDREIFLEVSHVNQNAIKFYQKNGFAKISERKNYYSDNSSAIVMKYERNNQYNE